MHKSKKHVYFAFEAAFFCAVVGVLIDSVPDICILFTFFFINLYFCRLTVVILLLFVAKFGNKMI